jgi:hypothetical protein
MPRTRLPRDEEGNIIRNVPVENESPEETKVDIKKNYTVATVLSERGMVIRTYSKELHGEGFEDNAKSMSDQHPNSTIELT